MNFAVEKPVRFDDKMLVSLPVSVVIRHRVLEGGAIRTSRPQFEPLGLANEPLRLVEDQLLECLGLVLVAPSGYSSVNRVEQDLQRRCALLAVDDRVAGDVA